MTKPGGSECRKAVGDQDPASLTVLRILILPRLVCQQVWSLAQFYSVVLSQSRIGVKISAFSMNAQSRFASVVVDGVLGPPRLARQT